MDKSPLQTTCTYSKKKTKTTKTHQFYNLQELHYRAFLSGCTTPPSVSSINRILRTRAAERAAEELTMMLETQERMRESLNVRLLQSHTQPPPTTPPIYPIPLLQPFWSGTHITLDNSSHDKFVGLLLNAPSALPGLHHLNPFFRTWFEPLFFFLLTKRTIFSIEASNHPNIAEASATSEEDLQTKKNRSSFSEGGGSYVSEKVDLFQNNLKCSRRPLRQSRTRLNQKELSSSNKPAFQKRESRYGTI